MKPMTKLMFQCSYVIAGPIITFIYTYIRVYACAHIFYSNGIILYILINTCNIF